ncbi:MAG: hypothetical protein ACI4RD_03560 [Kiritimatiellia bacterium]
MASTSEILALRRPEPVYVFVIWHRGMAEAERILGAIRSRFTVLKQFDVRWRPRDYVRNLAAFYGWKCYGMWVGKKRRSGTGVFRAVVVRDERPVFSDAEGRGLPETLRNDNVYDLKVACRGMTAHSNVVHASVNEAETRHNLRALTGETLEEFLSRVGGAEGPVEELAPDRPLPYVAYPYAEENGKGPRFFAGRFGLNRVELFLLPRCGLPTIFSFSVRFGGLFSFVGCIGKVKVG